MRPPVKARLALATALASTVFAVAGCSGGGGSGADPASLAPPRTLLFIEATLQPEGELASHVESLAKSVGGIDDIGGRIVSELESSANSSGEELDYEKDIAPWLGEQGGLFFQEYDGDDFTEYGFAVQTTDAAASQEFIDEQAGSGDAPVEGRSYDGIEYKAQPDGTTIGVIGDFVAIAEDERTFKAMVDASGGESLAGEDRFASAIVAAAEGSLADVFVDVGELIDRSGDSIDPDAKRFLDSAGIEPEEATAVASLIPGSDQIEVELSSDLGGDDPPTGDAASLLGSLPADSVAAVASADFGKRLEEAIDEIDAEGIPGEVPPNQLKSTLKKAGIDLEKVAASVGDLGVFAAGDSESSLGGAAVLTTTGSKEAANTVANVGLLLRATRTPGVTAISGQLSGFSVRDREELGPKPLVVAAKGERIAIAYGLPAARRALVSESGQTLADDPTYKEAAAALGSTPISGFADGPAALKLASALVPADDEDFREAKPYLAKVDYVAIGGGSSGDQATAKLIAGIGR
jgi:hypothetical protein